MVKIWQSGKKMAKTVQFYDIIRSFVKNRINYLLNEGYAYVRKMAKMSNFLPFWHINSAFLPLKWSSKSPNMAQYGSIVAHN